MVTWSVISALNASARKNSWRRSRSRLETRWRATGPAERRDGRPPRPPRGAPGGRHGGLVHRDRGGAVPDDPALVAERLPERLAQHDPHVLDGVVLVDLDVALRLDTEVHQPVLRPRLEHVAEERNRGVPLRRARAVQVQLERDLRLLGLALDPRLPP